MAEEPDLDSIGSRARLHRSSAFAFVAAVVLTQSGCMSVVDARRQHLPPPPSERLRSELGTVRLSDVRTEDSTVVFSGPAKGAGEGAARGAGMGGVATIAVGAAGGGYGVIAGIFLAPVGAVVGAVAGAVSAESAATIEAKERPLRAAMQDLRFPETFHACVADSLRERNPAPDGPARAHEPASTVLEVLVERFGLEGLGGINPPLSFILTERTRLIRASDGVELYGHWLTYRGRPRSLDEWVSESPYVLRQEAARACRDVAERLTEEVFFLYLPSHQLWGVR